MTALRIPEVVELGFETLGRNLTILREQCNGDGKANEKHARDDPCVGVALFVLSNAGNQIVILTCYEATSQRQGYKEKTTWSNT